MCLLIERIFSLINFLSHEHGVLDLATFKASHLSILVHEHYSKALIISHKMPTTKTPTTRTPQREWKSNSQHGGLLFLLFATGIYNPEQYSAAEIYDDEDLPFFVYSRKNFKTYCSTASKRAILFNKHGTGNLSKAYRQYIDEAKVVYHDLLESLLPGCMSAEETTRTAEDEESDDEYTPDGEEDIELDADEVESLTGLFQDARLTPALPETTSPAKMPPKKVTPKKTPTKKAAAKPLSSQCTPTKSIVAHSDGRISARWKLEQNWDGEIYLSPCQMKLMERTVYDRKEYFGAASLLNGSGIIDRNHIMYADMQAERERTFSNMKNEENGEHQVTVERPVFELPYQVKKLFQDEHGNEDEALVTIDTLKTGEWAQVIMEGVHVKKEVAPRSKIRRRGTVANNSAAGSGRVRGRDDASEAEQQDEHRSRSNRGPTGMVIGGDED